jgi:predicted HAD superfamily Cof-like phosphohydrolase
MKEIKALNLVKEFHDKFNHLVGDKPSIPSLEICKLRITLLQEELDELIEALGNNDIVEAADALMDIQYVLSGAILSLGLGEIASELFDEIQRSNMSKLCKTLDEGNKTIDYYTANHIACSLFSNEDQFIVLHDYDKKVLKSINYSPANLKPIIDKALDPRTCHENAGVCYPIKGNYKGCEGCKHYY